MMSDPQDKPVHPEPEVSETGAAPETTAAAPSEPEEAAGAEPEATAGAEPEATAGAEPEAAAGAEPEAAADAEPEAAADAEPEATADAEPEATADAEPEAATDAESGASSAGVVKLRKKKSLYAADVAAGQAVDGVFLVRRKQLPVDRTGNTFLAVTLVDRSGKLEARLWETPETVAAGFREGDYVRLQGQAVTWQGRLQVRVDRLDRIELAETGLPVSEFVAESRSPADRMLAEVVSLVDGMGNQHLRALVHAFLDDPAEMKKFRRAPAAQSVHHAWMGGLLEHTLSTMKLAQRLCDHYPQVDRDLVMAGTFFHDYGKVDELSYESGISYSDSGRLVGHLVLCSQWIHTRAQQIPGFPQPLLDQLVHTVLSHHGALEYGSPKRPKTLEALVVHYADVLDARIASFTELLQEAGPEGWTDYNRIYDRPLYRTGAAGAAPASKAQKKRKRKKKKAKDGAPTPEGGAEKAAAPTEGEAPAARRPRGERRRDDRGERGDRADRNRGERGERGERRKGGGSKPPASKTPLTFNPFAALAARDEATEEAAPAPTPDPTEPKPSEAQATAPEGSDES